MNAFLLGLALVYPHSITPGGVQPGFLRLYPHGDMKAWVNYRGDDAHSLDRSPGVHPAAAGRARGPLGQPVSRAVRKQHQLRASERVHATRAAGYGRAAHLVVPATPPEIPGEPWSFAFDFELVNSAYKLPPDGSWPDVPLPPSSPRPRYPPVGHMPVGPAPPLTWAGGFPWSSPPPGVARVSETPEPTTWGMVELGILLLVLHGRKRKGE